jgi:hypothetical protein
VLPPIGGSLSLGEEKINDTLEDESKQDRPETLQHDEVDSDLSEEGEEAISPAPLHLKEGVTDTIGFDRNRILSVDARTEVTISNSSKKLMHKPKSPRRTQTTTTPSVIQTLLTTTNSFLEAGSSGGSKKAYNKTRRRFPIYFVKESHSPTSPSDRHDDEEEDAPHLPSSIKRKNQPSQSFLRKQFTKM